MKPYYWYARRRPQRRLGRWPAIIGVAFLAVLAAGVALWLRRHDPRLPGLPRIGGRLPKPRDWESFERTPGPPGALLRVEGAAPLFGAVAMTCSPWAPAGVQIALRTGAPAVPVVALRFASLAATAPAAGVAGELYLTGRDPAGALIHSTGKAELTLARREAIPGAAGGPGAVGEILAGTIHGTFHGPAGDGEIEVRLRGCPTAPPPPGIWGQVPEGAAAGVVPEET